MLISLSLNLSTRFQTRRGRQEDISAEQQQQQKQNRKVDTINRFDHSG